MLASPQRTALPCLWATPPSPSNQSIGSSNTILWIGFATLASQRPHNHISWISGSLHFGLFRILLYQHRRTLYHLTTAVARLAVDQKHDNMHLYPLGSYVISHRSLRLNLFPAIFPTYHEDACLSSFQNWFQLAISISLCRHSKAMPGRV